MGSLTVNGVWSIAYSHDHEPPHVHAFYGGVQVLVGLREDGSVIVARRKKAIVPANVKRSDVQKVLRAAARAVNKLMELWEETHGESKVGMTDAEIDAAIARCAQEESAPVIRAAKYRPGAGLELFVLQFSNGRRLAIPREDLQDLAKASKAELMDYRLIGGGTGIWWDTLDVGFSAEGLLKGLYGNKPWMAELNRRRKLALKQANAEQASGRGKRITPRRQPVAA